MRGLKAILLASIAVSNLYGQTLPNPAGWESQYVVVMTTGLNAFALE